MKCPFCSHCESQVLDSRSSDDGLSIKRRRRCLKCDKRYTTYEKIELSLPTVVKKNGVRMEFDINKVRSSMSVALRKRPVSRDDLDNAVSRVQEHFLNFPDKEVQSYDIGQVVMKELKSLDPVAYVRFASVYQSFEDIDQFVITIKELLGDEK
ncbi:transcriptional regulator NrdR [Taylorella equigenitalis]|nr:transcriptional regulator NrdR [Taylorella equigenitalis]AFN36429.1 transcriptional repressor [Taylorella equigenitalis ATCC 35865]ASY30998.1 transcriptional regulator NrdR [Taylorella equigenitalis]ASY38301.1 transcriptional repressor NrdR [Taylorella equigenitalis]ASY39830.1 transcriptional regulator NrdR [Taylorella equigenitalis]ASY41276.1 transcriptional regulator NrdR [Taylorella equigenitalis]